MLEQVHLFVFGRVQGVFFRAETRDKAIQLGLRGFVRNTHDDAVEIVAQGKKQELEKFIGWCRHGPDAAEVEKVTINWESPKKVLETFEIRYD